MPASRAAAAAHSPWMAVVSATAARLGPANPLCACKGSASSTVIEVVGFGPKRGAIYTAAMNGSTVCSSSRPSRRDGPRRSDRGTTNRPSRSATTWLTSTSPSTGRPAATRGAQSHNGGASWTDQTVDSGRYYFDFDSDVAPTAPSTSPDRVSTAVAATRGHDADGDVEQHVFISRDRGATWENRVINAPARYRLRRRRLSARLPLSHIALGRRQQPRGGICDGATVAGGRRRSRPGRRPTVAGFWNGAGPSPPPVRRPTPRP
jgi:hypothetical protein